MNHQPTTLGAGYARHSDPISSHAAGIQIADKTERLHAIIEAALGRAGAHGLSTLEMARVTGLDRVTLSPRMKPMEGLGLVVRHGKRKGPSGVSSDVWMLPFFAAEANKPLDS